MAWNATRFRKSSTGPSMRSTVRGRQAVRRARCPVERRRSARARRQAQSARDAASQVLLRFDGAGGRGPPLGRRRRRSDPTPVRPGAHRSGQRRRPRTCSTARSDDPGSEEKAEAQGLLGRIGKQLYVNAVNADPSAATEPAQRRNLERALAAYEPVYRSNPSRYSWHGINTVALLARAKRDGVTLASTADAAAIASDILAIVEAMPVSEHSPPYWDLATAAEASLALGKVEQALTWIAKYVSRPEADAFELSSTERQLREVGGSPSTIPRARCSFRSSRRHPAAPRGHVHLQPSEVGTALARTKEASGSRQLEQILGKDGVVSLKWYQQGLERARPSRRSARRRAKGTGRAFSSAAATSSPSSATSFSCSRTRTS